MNPVIVVEGRDDTRRLREIYPISKRLKRTDRRLTKKRLRSFKGAANA